MKKKIWELEREFIQAFDEGVETIKHDKLTLRQVIQFGFNNLYVHDESGFVIGCEEIDFSEILLNSIVKYDYWDEDLDGYRILYLTIEN